MKRIDMLTEEFKSKYDRFMTGCDALEELKEWNLEELGEMDVFYQNELISVILRLIAADGEISGKEAEYLNKCFGFAFSAEELADVYETCREEIGVPFGERFKKGAEMMRAVNEKLADAYRELLRLVCDIIIESDGVVERSEIEEAKDLKQLLE